MNIDKQNLKTKRIDHDDDDEYDSKRKQNLNMDDMINEIDSLGAEQHTKDVYDNAGISPDVIRSFINGEYSYDTSYFYKLMEYVDMEEEYKYRNILSYIEKFFNTVKSKPHAKACLLSWFEDMTTDRYSRMEKKTMPEDLANEISDLFVKLNFRGIDTIPDKKCKLYFSSHNVIGIRTFMENLLKLTDDQIDDYFQAIELIPKDLKNAEYDGSDENMHDMMFDLKIKMDKVIPDNIYTEKLISHFWGYIHSCFYAGKKINMKEQNCSDVLKDLKRTYPLNGQNNPNRVLGVFFDELYKQLS